MRVSLFGLSPRCINLMNPKSKLVWLVLSTFLFNQLFEVLLYAYVYLCFQFGFQYMLSLFGFIDTHVFTGFSDFLLTSDFPFKLTGQCLYPYAWIISLDYVHVCLPMHATWLHFTYSLGTFLTPLDFHVQILDLRLFWAPCCWSE